MLGREGGRNAKVYILLSDKSYLFHTNTPENTKCQWLVPLHCPLQHAFSAVLISLKGSWLSLALVDFVDLRWLALTCVDLRWLLWMWGHRWAVSIQRVGKVTGDTSQLHQITILWTIDKRRGKVKDTFGLPRMLAILPVPAIILIILPAWSWKLSSTRFPPRRVKEN